MKVLIIALMFFCAWCLPGANLPLDEIRKFAAEATAEKYPDADRILISNYQVAEYDREGLGTTVDDFYEKILTEKGRREHQTIPFHFNTHYTKMEVLTLELIKPDGRVVPVDVAANSKVMTEPGQMSSNIYDPNQKVLQVSIPGLEVGDIIHTVYRDTTLKLRIKGVWTDFITLQSGSPIHYYEFVVNAPKELPLRNKVVKDEVKGSIAYNEEEKDGRIIYRWTARNVPQIFTEPSMPPMYMVAQRLLLSTAGDWQEISRWYWDISAPRLDKVTPEMKAKVAELVKGITDDTGKINAIFHFVSRDVRYAGRTLESEAPGYEPHDVNITFESLNGVCRDKAALLAALLREAGFEAYPVLFYSGPKKDPEVPNNYFNHAITAVKMKDGSYMLMDSTNEVTPEIFPSYLSDMSYLVATPAGETLRTSPMIPAEKNRMAIATTGKLDKAGTLTAVSTITFGGINDDIYRGAFMRWDREQLRQFATRQLAGAIPGAALNSLQLQPEDLRDMGKPLQLILQYTAKNFFIRGDGLALFAPQWLGNGFGAVNFVLDSTGLKERRYPMKLFSTCATEETFSFDFPDELKLELMPESGKIVSAVFDWKRRLELKDKKIDGYSYSAFKSTEITPAQYLELKKSLSQVEFEEKKTPIFKVEVPAAELLADANAVYEEWLVDFKLENPMEWTKVEKVRKKILRFGGVRSNSELKFHYNSAGTELKLVQASVTQPDGGKLEVSAQDINVMDEPWVGSAPRYPAGKIMVVSLPRVQAGSVIEYTLETKVKGLTPFSMIAMFQDFDPVVYKKVTVSRPNDAVGKWDWYGTPERIGLRQRIDVAGDRTVFTWEIHNSPAIKPEAALPYTWQFAPSKMMRAGGEPKPYAKTVKEALAKNMAQLDVSWLKGTERAARIREIRDFAAKNIRSAGPAFTELPLSCLTPADKTLRDGYGNSADRAVLTASLLKSAGIDSRFVLASSLPDLEYYKQEWNLLFMPSMYNQVLVVADGYVLNDTDQYAPLTATAHNDKLVLNLDSGKQETVKGDDDRTDIRYEIALTREGGAAIRMTRTSGGMLFAAKNRLYSEMTPELKARHEQGMAAAISENAVQLEPLKVTLDGSTCTEELYVKVDRFAVENGEYLQFDLPGNIAGSLIRPLPEKREYPYFIGINNKVNLTYTIKKPSGTRMSAEMLPPNLKYKYVEVQSYDIQDITISVKADFSPAILSPADYLTLQAVQAKLSHPSMNTVLLKDHNKAK